MIQGQKDEPEKPEYVIVANIKNLCDFGDRVAKRTATPKPAPAP